MIQYIFHKNWLFSFFFFLWLFSDPFFVSAKNHSQNNVDDLQVLGDYRSIKLKWHYSNKDISSFKIRYCEINNWYLKSRCKDQIIELQGSNDNKDKKTLTSIINRQPEEAIIDFRKMDKNNYEASINSLRVQTNYSVSVQPITLNDDKNTNGNLNAVIATTKSFTAKTLKCLANSSEIQVFTGPYFSGRISVEGSDNPACLINGDRNNPQESYNFSINHDLCKSKTIDKTRIETVVIVNENREILTHNSRRYLVICGFDPDKYTLTASVAVPSFLLKKLFDRLKEKPLSKWSRGNVTKFEPSEVKRSNKFNHKGQYSVLIESNSIPKLNKEQTLQENERKKQQIDKMRSI